MEFRALFLVLFLSFLYLSFAQGSYENCCLKYNKNVRHKTLKAGFKSYRKQETDGGCNIQAIVLTTNSGGKIICANPTAKWVKKIMAKIDKQTQDDQQKKMK
ncbi:C-C motif chemokine 25-like [Erpetoichthys calabaricus]|uniref:C-C motif chemokine 25-like n=1 Tax=Erpetoichthys calabaricus TaxID=27687 RepID=UPI00109FFFD1|nr:C-C motif chemokine 25-like [Erpetoichthys calabaricus]